MHLRERIVDALYDLMTTLMTGSDRYDATFPIHVPAGAVLKRWEEWSALDQDGLIPAILLMPGKQGEKRESETVGYLNDFIPYNIVTVLKGPDRNNRNAPDVLDQDSDMHYSIEKLINGSRDLGIEGVQDTRIDDYGGTEELLHPFLLTKYRVIVEVEYNYTESV